MRNSIQLWIDDLIIADLYNSGSSNTVFMEK